MARLWFQRGCIICPPSPTIIQRLNEGRRWWGCRKARNKQLNDLMILCWQLLPVIVAVIPAVLLVHFSRCFLVMCLRPTRRGRQSSHTSSDEKLNLYIAPPAKRCVDEEELQVFSLIKHSQLLSNMRNQLFGAEDCRGPSHRWRPPPRVSSGLR